MDSVQLGLIIVPPLCAGIGYFIKYILDRRSSKVMVNRKNKLSNIEYKLKEFYYPIYTNLLRENCIWNKLLNIYSDKNTINKLNSQNSQTYMQRIADPSEISIDINNNSGKINNYNGGGESTTLSAPNDLKDTTGSNKQTIECSRIHATTSGKIHDQKIMLELDREILSIHLVTQKIIQDNFILINPNPELMKLLLKYDEHVTIYNILRKINPNVNNISEMKYPYEFDAGYPNELLEHITNELYKLRKEQDSIYNSLV